MSEELRKALRQPLSEALDEWLHADDLATDECFINAVLSVVTPILEAKDEEIERVKNAYGHAAKTRQDAVDELRKHIELMTEQRAEALRQRMEALKEIERLKEQVNTATKNCLRMLYTIDENDRTIAKLKSVGSDLMAVNKKLEDSTLDSLARAQAAERELDEARRPAHPYPVTLDDFTS